ncbi:hypothetical protein BCR33DRAFT_738380 [Rhizoclosmatium globosum]|uniref:Uncharacterized protein n=1 Tax=Rhizoclosmatium globosum TaxID=329046 RepID=A0A1Y2C9A9_9FUNG|nr:hypothetical protein BCR33DRAFT_738380 [Rhizoclosmatium globosum]|eukprot:ORY43623.1 hypothetical protein BCR33DRAFT_738380 [Rhizoclosmatium globosum]
MPASAYIPYVSPDGNTPPFILNPSINTPENQRSIAFVIGIFVAFFPIFYFFQIVVNKWALGLQTISSNFELILKHLIAIPTRKEIIAARGLNLLPFAFLTLLVVSFIVIQCAISKQTGNMLQPFDIDTTLAQTGMILFFIGSNGFLVSRIHEYYKDKTEMRKKAAAHAFKIANNKRTQPVHPMGPSAQGPTIDRAQPPTNQNSEIEITVESSVLAEPASLDRVPSISTDAFETLESEKPQQPIKSPTQQIFDKQFGYVRRLKHILPQYNKIHITFGNMIQISVIFIEFIQLASFPYRDLLVNQNFQRSLGYDTSTGKSDAVGNEFISWIRSSFSLISAGFPEVSTLVLSNIKFAIAWWISLLGVLVAAGFIGIKGALKEDYAWIKKYPRVKKVLKVLVEGPYIIYFEPLTSIFYLILLGSFIEPLGCLSSNKTPLWPPQVGNTDAESFMLLQNAIKLREEQCAPLLLNPPLQVWFTVIGYLLGYYLLTIFKICDEQKPKDGIVTFTTRSEVLNKNGSLTLLLLYTLIPTSDSTTLR